MADTIIGVKDARFQLSTKETFFQIKADQKAIMTNSKTGETRSAYISAYELWSKQTPPIRLPAGMSTTELFALKDAHQKAKPSRPWILDCSARSMNIIYGMLRGHSYREIENKYGEHHGPDKFSIEQALAHYGIGYAEFIAACGEIDYE